MTPDQVISIAIGTAVLLYFLREHRIAREKENQIERFRDAVNELARDTWVIGPPEVMPHLRLKPKPPIDWQREGWKEVI